MPRFTIEIDVYSDLVCPWCYLGKEALDKAIAIYKAQHPEADFKLIWKPYLLWPNVGVSAYERGAGLRAIYGPNTPAVLDRLARFGAQYGIEFRWDGKSGNSRDAHKLVLLAMERDAAAANATPSSPTATPAPDHHHRPPPPSSPTEPPNQPPSTTTTKTTTTPAAVPLLPPHTSTHQHRTLTHLFTASFQHGADLSSRAFLARAAVEPLNLFLTEADALAYLARDDTPAARAVDASSASAAARLRVGVGAVPSYVVQSRWQVGGMQGEDIWMGVFERVRRASAATSGLNGSGNGGDDGVRKGMEKVESAVGDGRVDGIGNGEGRPSLQWGTEQMERDGGNVVEGTDHT